MTKLDTAPATAAESWKLFNGGSLPVSRCVGEGQADSKVCQSRGTRAAVAAKLPEARGLAYKSDLRWSADQPELLRCGLATSQITAVFLLPWRVDPAVGVDSSAALLFFFSFATFIFFFLCFLGFSNRMALLLFTRLLCDQVNVCAWCWSVGELISSSNPASTNAYNFTIQVLYSKTWKKLSELAHECSKSSLWYVIFFFFVGGQGGSTRQHCLCAPKEKILHFYALLYLFSSLFLSFRVWLHSLAVAVCHSRNRKKKGQSLGIFHQQPQPKEFYFHLSLCCQYSEKLHCLTLKGSFSGSKWNHPRVFRLPINSWLQCTVFFPCSI